MTRAGSEADRKARWCPNCGVGAGVWAYTGKSKTQCSACLRTFDVNPEWTQARRVPRHKRPEDVQDHHRPRNIPKEGL